VTRPSPSGARSREGVTQRELADMTGMLQRHISEMETGKRQIWQIGKERAKKLAIGFFILITPLA